MAQCKDCIHEKVCVIKAFPDAFENTQWEKEPCDHFKDADVVPKNAVHCIGCGEIIPEGRQVCPKCERIGGE